MSKDYFEQKAGTYEQVKTRVANVENIANSILNNVKLSKTMHIVDFGSGTGLLLERVAPFVSKITAVDISKSMNKQLEDKRGSLQCDLEILEMDMSKSKLDAHFDGVISSMTMHHVEDIPEMLSSFYTMLNDDGFLALADLDLEDGSFHTEDTGIYHYGFDRDAFTKLAREAGFKNVRVTSASVVSKPYGEYPVFLLTGNK